MQKIKIGHRAKFRAKSNVSRRFYFPFARFYAAFNFRWAHFDSFSWRVHLHVDYARACSEKPFRASLSWLPIVFCPRALTSKISRWRKRSNSTPKSRARSRSKMPTTMPSKLLKFVYRKCCVDRFRFQNICRLNRRPQLSLLDVKEKYTRHAGVSTNEADFMWFVRLPRPSSEAKQDGILPHIFAVLGVVCGLDSKAKM